MRSGAKSVAHPSLKHKINRDNVNMRNDSPYVKHVVGNVSVTGLRATHKELLDNP